MALTKTLKYFTLHVSSEIVDSECVGLNLTNGIVEYCVGIVEDNQFTRCGNLLVSGLDTSDTLEDLGDSIISQIKVKEEIL